MIINKFLSLFNRYKTDSPTFTIVGVGPGDPSLLTIAAVDAIKKAKVIVFPLSDTVELAYEYGIKAIIQPGGSLSDQESIDMCNSKGISMVFTQKRHFLH